MKLALFLSVIPFIAVFVYEIVRILITNALRKWGGIV